MERTLRFLLTAGLAAACVWGQRTGGTVGPTGGTPGGTTGNTGTSPGTGISTPGNLPSIGGPAQPLPTTSAPPPPIFLSGTVAMDDGSPLPGSVDIQAVCGVTQRIVDHTSINGDFGFKWSSTSGAMFEDASENGGMPGQSSGSGTSSSRAGSGGLPDNPLADCELRVNLAGYTSSYVNLYNHQQFDTSDVGTITLHRLTGDEGDMVSALSLKAPKDAKKNFEKGSEQLRVHKTPEAAASFQKAVNVYPQYADAWLELGRARLQLGSKDDARAAFQKAMDLDGKLVGAWQELGYMASDESRWPDAGKYLDQAVKLDPVRSPTAWYFDAMVNFNLGKFDVAERSIRTEMKLDTAANPRAEYLLGVILISRKDLAGGTAVLRKFVETYPDAAEAAPAKKILARAENATPVPHQ